MPTLVLQREGSGVEEGRYIAERVAARAGAGEVLVSQTVRDLVAGAEITFEDRGVAELKGVPGEWRLWAVEAA